MKKYLLIPILLITAISSCKKDKGEEENKFERTEMLKNYADNLIIPAFKDLKSGISELKSATETFTGNVNEANLIALQDKWVNAYTLWQFANAYNFGPAGPKGLNRSLSEEIATYPVSETKIENAISNPNFTDFNRDARGFLAIEYLVFDLDKNNQSILTAFDNQDRKKYLKGAVFNIEKRIDEVLIEWHGSYFNEFLKNNGTDAGSSTSQLYNEFVKSYETIKNFKIELPLGKRPGQTQAEPHLVEAYYSGKSLDFIKTHAKAIEYIYYGKSKNGTDRLGFKDYLENVTGGPALVESTLKQWEKVLSSLNAIPTTSSLSDLIKNNPKPVEEFGVELQKHTRFFKSDMSSMLGIAITYSSGDGD